MAGLDHLSQDLVHITSRIRTILTDTFLKENATISDVLNITREIEYVILSREKELHKRIEILETKLKKCQNGVATDSV